MRTRQKNPGSTRNPLPLYIYTKSYIFIHNLFARLRRLMLLAIEGGREFRDWREEGNIVTKTSFT